MLAVIALLDRLEPRVKTTESAQMPAIVSTSGGLPVEGAGEKDLGEVQQQATRKLQQSFDKAAFGEPGTAGYRDEAPSTTVPQVRLFRYARLEEAESPKKAEQAVPKADAPVAQAKPTAPAAGRGGVGGSGGGADKADDAANAAKPDGVGVPAERADRFGGVDVLFGDLAASVRSIGPVQLAALVTSPGAADAAGKAVTSRSWVVTGSAADVRAFLANVSDASRTFGYEVQNGEVEASTVVTRAQPQLPRPSGPSSPGPQGTGGGKAKEPEVRVVLVIDA